MATIQVTAKRVRGPGGGTFHPLRGTGTLTLGDGSATLEGVYDPPYSGWIAFLPTIATGVVVGVVASEVGAAAGPGWIIWYLLIREMRKKPLRCVLAPESVGEAVLDRERGLFAVRTRPVAGGVGLAEGWLGMRLVGAGPGDHDALGRILGDRLRLGPVQSTERVKVVVLCVLLAILAAMYVRIALMY
jgi:hypothetical protein